MNADARVMLEAACSVVALAQLALSEQKETLKAFINEARDMESFGHIVDPTLYRDPERRAVEKVLLPIFEAAIRFSDTYEKHLGDVTKMLGRVKEPESGT